jgi:hypothetical protein
VMRRRKLDVLHSLKAKVKRQARREELLPPVHWLSYRLHITCEVPAARFEY